MRIVRAFIAVGFVALNCFDLSGAELDGELKKAATSLSQQFGHWNNLTVVFSLTSTDVSSGLSEQEKATWVIDKNGREKLLLQTAASEWPGERPDLPWQQDVAHNGEFSTTFDSQGTGSGTVGSRAAGSLSNLFPPKMFIYVSGVNLGQPIDVSEYLSEFSNNISEVTRSGDGRLTIVGTDCFSPSVSLRFVLDPNVGYQIVSFERFDKKGPRTRFEVSEWVEREGDGGMIWLPAKGTWLGIDPTSRKVDMKVAYVADSIDVNQPLNPSDFVLTYQPGVLLHNTDTDSGFYITEQTVPADAPGFTGKSVMLAEYDRLQRLKDYELLQNQSTNNSAKWWLVIGNLLALATIAAIWAWRRRSQSLKS